MRFSNCIRSIGFLAFILLTVKAHSQVELKTTSLKISLGQKGELTGLTDMKAQKNYLFNEEPAYLLSIKIDDSIRHPRSLLAKKNFINKSILSR